MTNAAAFDRLGRVRDQAEAAAFVFSHRDRLWGSDPIFYASAITAAITLEHLRRTADSLELTFVVRVFAEFEAILREFWVSEVRNTQPDMRTLIDNIAVRRSIVDADRDGAHRIRELRNEIVHDGVRAMPLTFRECMQGLARYIRWLPREW